MRIALITDGISPYVLGGMQKHSFYLCKYLAQNKVFVHLIHFNKSSYDAKALGFFSEEEKKYIEASLLVFPKSLKFPGHYLYNSYRYSQLVYDQIKDNLTAYDFIYTKGFAGWKLLELKSKNKVACPPIGVNFHGFEMFQKAPGFKIKLQHLFLLRPTVKKILQYADIVFSYGGEITNVILSAGVPHKKIFELPSGIERNRLSDRVAETTDKINFVFLGRYERRKGIEELNEALKMFPVEETAKFSFHFIGPIPEEKKLNADFIKYHGEIRDVERLQSLLRKCDVLVCPSWSEGMPNVILEAMGAGLTVLATNTGATNVLINEETGWLIERPDPLVIYNTLLQILADKNVLNSKKMKALELIADRFIWEKLILRLIAFIRT